MSQPAHAHAYGLTRSRLNRVYVNQHAVETLHKDTRFWANNFDVALNHRRLVSMVRRDKRANNKGEGNNAPLPYLGINNSEFLSRVDQEWELIVGKGYDDAPLGQLQCHKRVLRNSESELAQKPCTWQPILCEDRLNIFMRAIALLEQGDQIKLGQLEGKYDELAAVIDKLRADLFLWL